MSQNQHLLNESRKRPAETDADEKSASSKIACPERSTENRDFMSEFRKLQAEADEVKNVLITKTAHLNSSIVNSGILGEIMRELKTIRTEIKENRQEIDEKLERITNELTSVRREIIKITPVRQSFLGVWKMVEHENFEGCKRSIKQDFEQFSHNINCELVDGKLKHTGGGYLDLIEGGKQFCANDLVVEQDHVKTLFKEHNIVDRYIQNGRMYVVENWRDDIWTRVYEKL